MAIQMIMNHIVSHALNISHHRTVEEEEACCAFDPFDRSSHPTQALPSALSDSVEQVQRFITEIFALQEVILAHADTSSDTGSFQAAVKAMQILDLD